MVYIYKKPIGNKSYYYLRASEKKGKKSITKDIAYLGSTINEVKISLDKLSKYKEQIRKSYKTINSFLESNHFLEKAHKLKLKRDSFLKDKTEEVEACKIHYIEGFARRKNKVNVNFLEISYGSLQESKYLLDFCFKEKYLNEPDYKKSFELANEIGAMLWKTLELKSTDS